MEFTWADVTSTTRPGLFCAEGKGGKGTETSNSALSPAKAACSYPGVPLDNLTF